MQRRHYYEQQYTSDSIPLESQHSSRGPLPEQPARTYSGHDARYERDDQNPFSNRHHNPELSSLSSAHQDHQDHQYHRDDYSHGNSNITPGADNFGGSASGGVAGIAYSVAEGHAQGNGAEAMRQGDHPPTGAYGNNYPQAHPQYNSNGVQNPFVGGSDGSSQHSMSNHAIGPAGASRHHPGNPYQSHPRATNAQLGGIDPNAIADDGDDGLEYGRPGRMSMLSLHSNPSASRGFKAGAAGGAAAGTAMGNSAAAHDSAAQWGGAAAAGGRTGGPRTAAILEKDSPWLKSQGSGKKKWRWAIIIGIIVIILAAIVGGVVGSILGNKNKGEEQKGESAEDDTAKNGDLGINSKEIKALMNNKDLHKVFPGMDYTPINTQYPGCHHNPPSQNNITRDLAIISQLTDTVRLYGTDCNQTQMVVHSIERLGLKDTMKVWLGVWQDGNTTTNDRQLTQMWDILDEYGDQPFAGLIVANEILFREEMDIDELGTLLSDTRKELKKKGLSLPVATSDLGDDLTQALVDESDYVMANIHPFFAGVSAKKSASWTWSFWEGTNGPLWKDDKDKNIIAEIGWPTSGGTNCGDGTSSDCDGDGSVASIDGVNELLEDWVCDALTNGTNYFWFSAFDEPWKASFNEKGKEWEDQWGLFTVNRDLKKGVTIPDCGGKTI
ncbi:hypothetical protein IMZ48_33400 [Candidatus Bathyarchaeota archaeon]|nr:hypothetical protein [Candidatus Bathyarchaeota archaeon]